MVALFRSKPKKTEAEQINDAEFGTIVLRRNANSKHVRLRMQENGVLSVTMPRFASTIHAHNLIEASRPQIRHWKEKLIDNFQIFKHGDQIGQSHTIHFEPHDNLLSTKVTIKGLAILVKHPSNTSPNDPVIQAAIKPTIKKALQKEARAYLPRRLSYLAEKYGFKYERVRYGTQKGRWGSCSSSGTISLNVGLMLLDVELIDYVLIHELCHTRQMNHSSNFWSLVESCLPDYKARRKILKSKNPTV